VSSSARPFPSPSAFISWAHSDRAWNADEWRAWQDTVFRFTAALRVDGGIVADVDLLHLHDPAVDWSTFGPKAIQENAFVLIVASPAYKARWEGTEDPAVGAGAAREANVLKALFDEDRRAFGRKVKVVVTGPFSDASVPRELFSSVQRFNIQEFSLADRAFVDLVRTLTGQPRFIAPEPGTVPVLPPEFISRAVAASNVSDDLGDDDAVRISAGLRSVELELEGATGNHARQLGGHRNLLESTLRVLAESTRRPQFEEEVFTPPDVERSYGLAAFLAGTLGKLFETAAIPVRGRLDDAAEATIDAEAEPWGDDAGLTALATATDAQALARLFTDTKFHDVVCSIVSWVGAGAANSGVLAGARHEARRHIRVRLHFTEGDAKRMEEAIERSFFTHASDVLEELTEDGRDRHARPSLAELTAAASATLAPLARTRNDLEQWTTGYRLRLADRLKHLVPPNVDNRTFLVPFEQLYVNPLLTQFNTLDEMVRSTYRTVVKGRPGTGKSTLAHAVALRLASDERTTVEALGPLVPFVVVLRDYSRTRDRQTIRQFLEATVRSLTQDDRSDPAVQDLLRQGRALVIFDGLDEILASTKRRDVVGDVEAFAADHMTTPIIVTSRVVGYDQAPLGGDWQVCAIEGFDNPRTEEYVAKWLRLDPQDDDESPQRLARLLVSLEGLPDLASEPLMLALICSMSNYGRRDIPKSRPEIYEACADLLYRRWDAERDIATVLPFKRHLRRTLDHLADWIYGVPDRESGVSRSDLISEAARFLYPRRFHERDEARAAAGAFCDFCTGRAWVFVEIGLDADDQPLFRFAHRTFLEFFAGRHLARHARTPADFATQIAPRIVRGEADLVAQIAMQLIDEERDGGADEALETLLEHAKALRTDEQYRLSSFVSRCLAVVVPSQQVVEAVVDNVVSDLIRHEQDKAALAQTAANLAELTRAGSEVIPIVIDALVRLVGELGSRSGSPAQVSFAAFAILSGIDLLAEYGYRPANCPPVTRRAWRRARAAALVDHAGSLGRMARTDPRVAVTSALTGNIAAAEACSVYFTPGDYYAPVGVGGVANVILPSIAGQLLEFSADTSGLPGLDTIYEGTVRRGRNRLLDAIADAWPLAPSPWLTPAVVRQADLRIPTLSAPDQTHNEPSAVYGLILLALPYLEHAFLAGESHASRAGQIDQLLTQVFSQGEVGEDNRAGGVMTSGAWWDALTGQQRDFIDRWQHFGISVTPGIG
jgi:hypothetical protein